MKEYKLSVEAFTVSYSTDTYFNGNKSSHFVSASVKSEPGVDPEDLPIVQLDVAFQVSKSVFRDAVMRGAISPEEASSRMENVKENYEILKARAIEARDKKSQENR